jgi:hypothetical protein
LIPWRGWCCFRGCHHYARQRWDRKEFSSGMKCAKMIT